MYENDAMDMKAKQSEHIEIASKMADEIFERYNPDEQNEMAIQIRNRIKERRTEVLERNLKQCDYLRSTLDRLS